MGCVYIATSKTTGKSYVGKSIVSMKSRIDNHLAFVRRNSPLVFHRAIRKYGINDFEWQIIFESDVRDVLIRVEIMEIKERNTKTPHGYNMTDGGEGFRGLHFTDEHRRKLSESNKRAATPELRALRSRIHKGKVVSEETRKKLSNAHKGKHGVSRPHGEETKRILSVISTKRAPARLASAATRYKMGSPSRGKTYEEIYGEEKASEQKRIRSCAMKGKPKSAETRAKLSAANKGKARGPFSEEHKQKIAEGIRRFHRNKSSGVVECPDQLSSL